MSDFFIHSFNTLSHGLIGYIIPFLFVLTIVVFFHELGHHVRGHCTIISQAEYDDLGAADATAILASMSPEEQAYFEPLIDEREDQADAWAMVNLAAFERRFGPFLAAMYGA